ncbi:DUF3788 family protein [Eisenbergiella porci]|uniref:DUF3788 family protein n=1 Tax=Eisenbergiella porci TaxID=2652274 RepID=UPI002A824A0B|nr:DUF3788 family protein [Eisenbergiella porci]
MPPQNGGRWLMIEVTDGSILEDVKKLIDVRMGRKQYHGRRFICACLFVVLYCVVHRN